METLIFTWQTGSAAHASIEGICLQGVQLLSGLSIMAKQLNNSLVDRG
jgi:hypothetical protein